MKLGTVLFIDEIATRPERPLAMTCVVSSIDNVEHQPAVI